MAKIESIRLFEHTLSFTADDEIPIVVTLRRMTVGEWTTAQKQIADSAAQSYGEELKDQLQKMIDAAMEGDSKTANKRADKMIDSVAHKGLRKMERDHARIRDDLSESIQEVAGLEGVESGQEVPTLLEMRPIMLELWEALSDASSLSAATKKA